MTGTTAGNITASTTGTEHASIGSSLINSAADANRFWTLTNGGGTLVTLPAAGLHRDAQLINGSPVDVDAGAVPAGFIVQRFSGGWTTPAQSTTCSVTPTPPGTNLCVRVTGLTAAAGFGDFAIGEVTYTAGNAGWFNVFESSTAGGALTGKTHQDRRRLVQRRCGRADRVPQRRRFEKRACPGFQ